MTTLPPSVPPRREAVKLGMGVLLRVLISITLLFAAYFLIPARGEGAGSDVPWLILELVVFGVIVAIQVPAIVKAKYPNLRAIEAMAVTIPLYLLIFARVYLSISLGNPAVFSHALDNVTSLYFTVTVFATVGFGDIVATTDGMKLLVTLQMLLNLVVIGLVIKLLSSAAQRGVARRRDGHSRPPPAPGMPPLVH